MLIIPEKILTGFHYKYTNLCLNILYVCTGSGTSSVSGFSLFKKNNFLIFMLGDFVYLVTFSKGEPARINQ